MRDFIVSDFDLQSVFGWHTRQPFDQGANICDQREAVIEVRFTEQGANIEQKEVLILLGLREHVPPARIFTSRNQT